MKLKTCPRHGGQLEGPCPVQGCLETLKPYRPKLPVVDDAGPTVVAPSIDLLEARANRERSAPRKKVRAELNFDWITVEITDRRVVIGRDAVEECGERIREFDNVSRVHAELWVENGQLYVRDLRSTNGTTVNEKEVPADGEPVALEHRDVLGFGATLRAVVVARGGAR